MRWRSTSLARSRRVNPPSSPEEVARLSKEQRDATEKMLFKPADKLNGGVVKELEIPVRKRGLKGVLEGLDGEETGQRTLRVRPAFLSDPAELPAVPSTGCFYRASAHAAPHRPNGSRTSTSSGRRRRPATTRSSSRCTVAPTSA